MDPTDRLHSLPWAALDGLQQPVRGAIARVLEGAEAERVVDRALRDRRELSRPQRTAVVEAIFGVALWRRRLAWHAGTLEQPADAPLLLFALLRDLAGLSDGEAARLAGVMDPSPPPRRPPPEALGVRWSLPDWIAASLARDFGAEADALCAALNLPGPVCLRANTLRATREALAARLGDENITTRFGEHSRLALVVEGPRPNILGLRAFREGLFEVQDEGSQLLGLLASAQPGETVLDACAGAGGKTLLLAAELANAGALHAHDIDQERLDRLERRAERAGVTNLLVHRTSVPEGLRCDAALVDVPCSELGALRRGPDARFRVREKLARSLPELQLRLLTEAAQHLRSGGRLVYATCTLRREENEDVVSRFLEGHPEFALRPAGDPWLSASLRRGPFLTTLPHRHGTDGFFAADLRRA
jgi:16S rRNA (cytosine967-C5)-methyltransferase